MNVTYNLEYIGQEKSVKINPFKDLAVEILNPYKQIANETFVKMMTFAYKKDAIKFCNKWGFSISLITKVESRFQKGYAIGLGRNTYAPDQADDYLTINRLGCIVNSYIDERKQLLSNCERDYYTVTINDHKLYITKENYEQFEIILARTSCVFTLNVEEINGTF